ncbi:MAG: crossover junction endodeoxyribonuclease RuvC [Spirochaetaceae bacterium]|jgi:crossover junction endodeoxyribonuclease RuvC|nr:crossover junction endodeoxyribonuclease RuvC [Spirochaetaceae bacterium]
MGAARRIIGVDPGLASSGWGVLEYSGQRARYLAHGCIETPASQNHAERLLSIYNEIRAVLDKWRPVEAAVEGLFFARNVKSAIPVAEARGVLCMALAQAGLLVREFRPNEIKKAVSGVATADKRQVQEMIRIVLGLEAAPRPDHAADALAAAICSAYTDIRYTDARGTVKE